MSDNELLHRLASLAKRTRIRIRLRELLRAALSTLPLVLIYVLGALTLIKVFHQDPRLEEILLWGGLIPTSVLVFSMGKALLKRLHPLEGARALDRHHELRDRVSNALSFGDTPEEQRSPLMRAAIEDARDVLDDLQPSKAAPLLAEPKREFQDTLVSLLLAACVYGVSLVEVRTTREIPPQVTTFQPAVLHEDDVELLKDWGKELEEKTQDPEAQAAVREFNQLVEDIADRRLERKDIFKRLQELESKLTDQGELSSADIDESLKELAQELKKSGLSKPVAEALENKNLPDAEQALRELAKKLKKKPGKVNRAELARLRKALEKASQSSQGRLDRLETQRQRIEEGRRRLLNKKKKGQKLTAQEQSALSRHERQLKHLDRQKKQAERTKKELSQLDKDLAKAAEELRKELGEDAARSLEQGAQDVNRMAKKELSKKEKENLKKQLEQLRQLLRQHKKGSKKRQQLLDQFRRRAQGGKSGKPGGKSGQGQGQQGQGKNQKPGQLSLGQGQGGVSIPIPGQGSTQVGQGQGAGQGQQGSESWGSGSDDNVKGDATDLNGQVQDVAAAGIDSGEGDASSEVVYTAAQRGFSSTGYRKVYTDYKTVAEEVMEHDEIPPGYKFYVRRYFQLIRPRH